MRTMLRSNAKSFRNSSTDAERLHWKYLRNSQLEGIKFRRQQPLGPYIVDFVSFESNLIIEVDGSQHADDTRYDDARTVYLTHNGFKVLRFWNHELVENLEGVLQVIPHNALE